MKRYAWVAALGLGVALGQAQEEAALEGTHAEIKPIEFSKHASGHPITIKTIALTHEDDLLVGISWGEGKMEFAQPSSDDEPSRRDRRSRGSRNAALATYCRDCL